MSSKLVLVSILSIFILSSCMEKKKPIIIGHRGAMGHETENTLASIKSAMALKVDMIEIDVFKLKNGEVVVFHDDTVDRLTDAKGHIEDFSFEEVRKSNLFILLISSIAVVAIVYINPFNLVSSYFLLFL